MEMEKEVKDGQALGPVVRLITQEKIKLYAEASGDFNPIHVDESFAARTPLGGTIAHGMLSLAYVSEMMTSAFGRAWLAGGKLRAKFKEPARPGDTLTISGNVDCIEKGDDVSYANCVFGCHNQKGDIIVTGEAVVKLTDDNK